MGQLCQDSGLSLGMESRRSRQVLFCEADGTLCLECQPWPQKGARHGGPLSPRLWVGSLVSLALPGAGCVLSHPAWEGDDCSGPFPTSIRALPALFVPTREPTVVACASFLERGGDSTQRGFQSTPDGSQHNSVWSTIVKHIPLPGAQLPCLRQLLSWNGGPWSSGAHTQETSHLGKDG